MAEYKEFHFRAPDVGTFLSDVEAICQNNGIDPYERGILRTDPDTGEPKPGLGIDAIPAGQWWESEPTEDADGNLNDDGVLGSYALVNVLTKYPGLEQLAQSFAASDPTKAPADIPDSEKIGSGTHRIDGSMLTSPVRMW